MTDATSHFRNDLEEARTRAYDVWQQARVEEQAAWDLYRGEDFEHQAAWDVMKGVRTATQVAFDQLDRACQALAKATAGVTQ